MPLASIRERNGQADIRLDVLFAMSPVKVPADQLEAGSRLRLFISDTPEAGAAWHLAAASDTAGGALRCSVNHRLLGPGEVSLLMEGDMLEVGFLRFAVEVERPTQIEAGFELVDLLNLPSRSAAPGSAAAAPTDVPIAAAHFVDMPARPFDDIIDAMQVDASEPLSSDADGAGESPAQSEAADGDTCAGVLQVGEPDPMPGLHADFLRAMRDPRALQMFAGVLGKAHHSASAAHAMEDLTKQAQGYEGILDVLGDESSIDDVLDGLDTSDLLSEEAVENVLRCFAPPELRAEPDPHARLPEMTLREHHAVSVDSAAVFDREPRSSKSSGQGPDNESTKS